MKLSIMQPAYLPWVGFFQRIAMSDAHVVLDHVHLDKSSKTKFANRNKIRTREGAMWLTVPLKTKEKHGDLAINTLEIDNSQAWALKHQRALQHSYARAPHFHAFGPALLATYDRTWLKLVDLLAESTAGLFSALKMQPVMRCSSDMKLETAGSELILDICVQLGATEYISGPFGRDYLDREAFKRTGVQLLFHEYSPEPYPQSYPGFEPFLSVVDMIFNCGPDSANLLRRGAKLLEI